jgi:hypothetical protein
LRHHNRCPTCRCFLDERQLIVSLLAKQMISAMSVKCVFSKRNDELGICCKWKGTVQDLDRHLKADCQLQIVSCGNGGCGETMARHALMGHKRNQCQMRQVSCPYCAQLGSSANLVSHTFSCLRRPVRCENRCTDTCFPFCEMDEHYRCCPFEPLGCPYYSTRCGDVCNGWILRKDWEKHTQDSANMNLVIQALFEKVERLEGRGGGTQSSSPQQGGREKGRRNRSGARGESINGDVGSSSLAGDRDYSTCPPRVDGGGDTSEQSGGGSGPRTFSVGGYTVRTVSARRYMS